MSTVTARANRVIISAQTRMALRNESGNALADYLGTALVAVALVMAVYAIVTTHRVDGPLQALVTKALSAATNLIKS